MIWFPYLVPCGHNGWFCNPAVATLTFIVSSELFVVQGTQPKWLISLFPSCLCKQLHSLLHRSVYTSLSVSAFHLTTIPSPPFPIQIYYPFSFITSALLGLRLQLLLLYKAELALLQSSTVTVVNIAVSYAHTHTHTHTGLPPWTPPVLVQDSQAPVHI